MRRREVEHLPSGDKLRVQQRVEPNHSGDLVRLTGEVEGRSQGRGHRHGVRQGYVSRCEQRPSNPQRRVRRVGRVPRQRHLQRLITGSYVDAV
jgi:hypothetical protein